jgi:hypothetical protein
MVSPNNKLEKLAYQLDGIGVNMCHGLDVTYLCLYYHLYSFLEMFCTLCVVGVRLVRKRDWSCPILCVTCYRIRLSFIVDSH